MIVRGVGRHLFDKDYSMNYFKRSRKTLVRTTAFNFTNTGMLEWPTKDKISYFNLTAFRPPNTIFNGVSIPNSYKLETGDIIHLDKPVLLWLCLQVHFHYINSDCKLSSYYYCRLCNLIAILYIFILFHTFCDMIYKCQSK